MSPTQAKTSNNSSVAPIGSLYDELKGEYPLGLQVFLEAKFGKVLKKDPEDAQTESEVRIDT